MKKRVKKIVGLWMMAVMYLMMIPITGNTVQAVYTNYYSVGDVIIGNSASGMLTEKSGAGWTWSYDADTDKGILTLTNAYIKRSGRGIRGISLPGNTTIKLNGNNTIAGSASDTSSTGIYCYGSLNIVDDASEGIGSLSVIGGNSTDNDSIGISSDDELTISSGKINALGGEASTQSIGIKSSTLEISNTADVTGIGGKAGTSSFGIDTDGDLVDSVNVTGGCLTGFGGYAYTGSSVGIYNNRDQGSTTVSAGVVTAFGGMSKQGNSIGIYSTYAQSPTFSGGTIIVGSNEAAATGENQAISPSAPSTGSSIALLSGAYDSHYVVYGNSTTYDSTGIISSGLDYTNLTTPADVANHITWNQNSKTLTLKNVIVTTADLDAGNNFGIVLPDGATVKLSGLNIIHSGKTKKTSNSSCDGASVAINGNGDLTITDGTNGSLIASSSKSDSFETDYDYPSCSGIFANGKVTLNNSHIISAGASFSDSRSAGSYGIEADNVEMINSDLTAVAGSVDEGIDGRSDGIASKKDCIVQGGQLLAIGGYACHRYTTALSGGIDALVSVSAGANVIASGDDYGLLSDTTVLHNDEDRITAIGYSSVRAKPTTTVVGKRVKCEGGTYTSSKYAVRFLLEDNPVIAVAHDGSTYTEYSDFAEGWNEAVGENNTENTTVKLLADWTAKANVTYGTSFGTGIGFGSGNTSDGGRIYVAGETTDEGTGLTIAAKTIILDLNGHTIDRNQNSIMNPSDFKDDGEVIYNDGGTLTIKDTSTNVVSSQGKITGGSAGGIKNSSNHDSGLLQINGGQIIGNKTTGSGAGIYNSANVIMTGGLISDNIANCDGDNHGCGGGVYSGAEGDEHFTMTGGSITGNYCCGGNLNSGGGVNNAAGTYTVGGTAAVTGNESHSVYNTTTGLITSNGITDNIYIFSDDCLITCSTTNPLQNGAMFGVTKCSAPTVGNPQSVTKENDANYSSYFFSDNSNYEIYNDGSETNQRVKLRIKSFAVSFANGGGTGTDPTQADTAIGDSFILPQNPYTQEGYTFAGWSDGISMYDAGDTYVMPANAVTLTAQWIQDGFQTKLEINNGINQVPDSIMEADDSINTSTALEQKMKNVIVNILETTENIEVKYFNVSLLVSQDDGVTWVEATENNFPAGGISVLIPWSDLGLTYEQAKQINFSVAHMFETSFHGHIPGEIESPACSVTAKGLQFVTDGLSPIAIGYKNISSDTADDGTDTSVTVTGTVTNDSTSNTTLISPNTGENTDILFTIPVMICSMVSIILYKGRKNKREKETL